jgi:hypothetical protein
MDSDRDLLLTLLNRRLLFPLAALLLLCSSAGHAACVQQADMRDDVLIVVNANSVDSPQIGEYYCERRAVNPANIVQVYVPATDLVGLDQFISLRDQLIRFLQQHTLAGSEPPVACDTAQGYTPYYCPDCVDQIRRLTRIRYLVMTRGVPTKFSFAGSKLRGPTRTSIDNYLRFWLLNYYAEDTEFMRMGAQRAADFADGRGMRTVMPERDREFIVGRIDGITAENAMQIVDRTIAAERNGIYGKLVSSKFGSLARNVSPSGAYWKEWLSNGTTHTVYPSWHYLHGLFGQLQTPITTAVTYRLNPECLTHDANGESPQDCVTRLVENAVEVRNKPPPGTPGGTIPRPDQTLVYQGYSDGFSSVKRFDDLLNWRDTDSCNTLCDPSDAVCKAASTDTYQEIDTRCVRVAEGFMGYNLQSWPVGSMWGSPTGWAVDLASRADHWSYTSSADFSYYEPRVLDNEGFDDSYSIRYGNSQQRLDASCYASGDDLLQPPQAPCRTANRIAMSQLVPVPEQAVNSEAPQVITVRFRYRALDLDRNVTLWAQLLVHESKYSDGDITILGNNQINYQLVEAAQMTSPNTPVDRASWRTAAASFTLDPALHRHPQRLFDAIKIRIRTTENFEGQLTIDAISADINGVDIPLQNPSFTGGHHQLSGGDSAASFLGRLNGVAFWGNLTHHGASVGRSFDTHPYETLIYFLRGLPLGDAVWFAEYNNSGILYGDPLYSPIAVHLHYRDSNIAGAGTDTFNRQISLALSGDTVNGTGSDVATTYSVDYCEGRDFFVCDQGETWVPIVGMQNLPGGRRNMALGNWDASTLRAGDYTLRLSVTSTTSTLGNTQTFNDYYPLTLADPPPLQIGSSGGDPSGTSGDSGNGGSSSSGGGGSSSSGGGGGSGSGSGSGGGGGSGSGGGGCALRNKGGSPAIDPLWPVLLLAGVLGVAIRIPNRGNAQGSLRAVRFEDIDSAHRTRP